MKRFRPLPIWLALTPLLLVSGMSVANAQPPGDPFDGGPLFDGGPGGSNGRGPGGRGPGGRGPGAKGHLDGLMHGLERLNGKSSDVSKVQSQKIVALIKPWTRKPAMSDADAQKLATSIEAVLTSAQKSNFGPPGPPGRGGAPGGFGGRGRDDERSGPPPDGDFDFGGPPPGGDGDGPPPPPPDGDFGGPPSGDRDGRGGNGPRGMGGRMVLPTAFNPFYAPTGRSDWKKLPSTTQQLLARRYRENRAVLERLSRRSK